MKTSNLIFLAAFSTAVLLTGCEKFGTEQTGTAPAIKVTVSGVETKASVITTSTLESQGVFKMSAYVTQPWQRDSIGNSGTISAGLYKDPVGGEFKDIDVKYEADRDNEDWRITGNEGTDYAGHKFSWVNNVTMNFFAYAPVNLAEGALRTIGKADASTDSTYPFTYSAAATDGIVTSGKCDDLIFAFKAHKAHFQSDESQSNYGTLVDGSSDKFDLTFYHALSQIRFCLSTDDGTFPSTLKLVSVKLKDITAAGSCTFNGVATTNTGRFTWAIDDTDKADYTQAFIDAQFGKTDSGTGKEIIPQNWEKSSYTGNSQTYNLYICSGDVLFLLPQNPAGKELDITLQIGTAEPFTVTAKLPAVDASDDTKIWEPGKYYTYKIKAFKTVTVELIANDWVDGGSEITI